MDPKLVPYVDATMPRFNKTIVEGFHLREFETGHRWLNHVFKLIFKDVERKGVIFDGISRVKPKEYIAFLKGRQPKVYDTHRESYYPVTINYSYKDPKTGEIKPFPPIYTMLAFCDRYGDMWIRDSQYSLQFVMAERGLSVTKEKSIFFKVLSFKTKIGAEFFRFDKVHTELDNMPHSTINLNLAANRFYSPTESRSITSKKTPYPLLSWYIFGNLGFSEAMKLYGECEYEIGPVDVLAKRCTPKDRWEIFTRSGSLNSKFLGDFIPLDIGIALRNKNEKRKDLSSIGMQYAAALLFVASCMSSYFELDDIDDKDYWKLLIGRCSVKPGDPNDYIMRLMHEHFDSINDLLEEDSIRKFASQSVYVKDVFELFNYIIANRSEIVQTTDRSSALNKELSSMEFTFDGLITLANQFKHYIKNNSELSYHKVKIFLSNNSLKLRSIDNARLANMILEPTPTDNPFSEYMLGCMPQHKVFSGKRKQSTGDFDVHDAANLTNASQPFIYSHQRVTKPYPNAGGYLNPCIHLINGNLTGIREERKDLYHEMEQRLKVREMGVYNNQE